MNHPQPALLTAGVDDPARRLIWATVEQSLTDLRDQRQRGSAAAFLADVLPALAPDMALMLGGYQALMGVLALALLGVAAVLLRAARREARWNNPALAKPPREDH